MHGGAVGALAGGAAGGAAGAVAGGVGGAAALGAGKEYGYDQSGTFRGCRWQHASCLEEHKMSLGPYSAAL